MGHRRNPYTPGDIRNMLRKCCVWVCTCNTCVSKWFQIHSLACVQPPTHDKPSRFPNERFLVPPGTSTLYYVDRPTNDTCHNKRQNNKVLNPTTVLTWMTGVVHGTRYLYRYHGPCWSNSDVSLALPLFFELKSLPHDQPKIIYIAKIAVCTCMYSSIFIQYSYLSNATTGGIIDGNTPETIEMFFFG